MEVLGYIASLFIGISLGLIGGGGSILTVPALVYLFSISPTIAISYSLFIVGLTSMAGAINNLRKGMVNMQTVMLFGSSSIVTVFIVRKFIIPNLPDVFFNIGSFQVTHALFVMVVFAILMVASSTSMIRSKSPKQQANPPKPGRLIIYGIFIGLVTGFLGAGGGFLLIPTLVLIMRLPMKKAVGTSLFIISLNSLIGFIGDIGRHEMNWNLLFTISAIAIAGIFIGGYLHRKVNSDKLKKLFGYFVLVMGCYIIIKELFL